MLAALISLALAAPPGNVAVVVARQDGVSQSLAKAHATATAQALSARGLSVSQPDVDALACAAKRPCLVGLLRGQRIPVLVIVELAGVLDEVDVFIEALSVEEDGRRLLRVETKTMTGKVAQLTEVTEPLAAAIHRYLEPEGMAAATSTPAGTSTPTPPPSVAPAALTPPAPSASSLTTAASTTPSTGGARRYAWIPFVVAGLAGITSGVFYGLTRSTEASIRAAADRERVRQLIPQGEAFQAVSGAGLGVALTSAVVGVVLLLVGEPSGS